MIRRAGRAVAGITLIEVMIVVAILAVLVALAAPNLSELFIRNRLDTASNEFETTLNFARSEAIRRGAKVVVRQATGSANQQWSRGWEVFVDLPSSGAPNGNNLRDPGEELLRVGQELSSSLTLYSSRNAQTLVYFSPDGRAVTPVNYFNFVLCYVENGGPVIATTDRRPRSRAVMVSDSGRIRRTQPNDSGQLIVESASNPGTAQVTDCRNP
jgi:type IV fimbrial biogenesis protein FimT